jgi:hypothetical protein
MLAGHLYLATVGTGGSLEMMTARRSRGTRDPPNWAQMRLAWPVIGRPHNCHSAHPLMT